MSELGGEKKEKRTTRFFYKEKEPRTPITVIFGCPLPRKSISKANHTLTSSILQSNGIDS